MLNTILLIWYISTGILTAIISSFIMHNIYNTNLCYNDLYNNITMYELIKIHLIIYTIVDIYQITTIILIILCILKKKNYIIFTLNLIDFVILCILDGFYLNFILTSNNNCLNNFKTSDIYLYIYFLVIFITLNITMIFILLNIVCVNIIN